MAAGAAGTGKIQENSTLSPESWISSYSREKNNIPPFSLFFPLFWDGGGSENPTEPPPEFSSGGTTPPTAIPPPKTSLQKSLGMTLNCSLLPKKVRALLGYFQPNSWGFVRSNFQGYFHAQLASIKGEFPDPTEISGAFKILSSLISWSQIRCLEGFGNFGIFSSCENLKWGIFLLLLLFNLE